MHSTSISIVIPSYRRGEILLEMIHHLLKLPELPCEILVIDQTEEHPPEVMDVFQSLEKNRSVGAADFQCLEKKVPDIGKKDAEVSTVWKKKFPESAAIDNFAEGEIATNGSGSRLETAIVRRIVLSEPSIPHAMNTGLLEAKGEIVLFLDDDVEPSPSLVAAHAAQHDESVAAVCGQVLQPGQEPEPRSAGYTRGSGVWKDLGFPFNSTEPADLENVMAGNLSVNREIALSVGGFDENYIGVAYRFETDFARRLVAVGHRIAYEPRASLRHLRLSSGGTRTLGDHLQCPSPLHSAGDYYFVLRHGSGAERIAYIACRLFRETVNRYYLCRPWSVLKKLWSEFQGLEFALRLNRGGPKLISAKERHVVKR